MDGVREVWNLFRNPVVISSSLSRFGLSLTVEDLRAEGLSESEGSQEILLPPNRRDQNDSFETGSWKVWKVSRGDRYQI